MTARPRIRAALPDAAMPQIEPVGAVGARTLLAALPFFLMGVVAAVDILAGPEVGFLPLLSLGPALAAVSLRPAQTMLVGVLATALCEALAFYDNLVLSRRAYIALATIAGVTAAGLIASAGRRRRERELASVRAVADMAQRVLMQPVPREVGGVEMATRYVSAAAAARIGGDLYAAVEVEGTVRLIVGDVQGKGLAATHTAAVVLGAFREAAYDAAGLTDIAERIERSLQRQAGEDEFLTAVLAQIRPGGESIEMLNCGHPPPLRLTAVGVCFLDPPEVALPIGLAEIATGPRPVRVVPFAPGDRVLFYTDGISEARDSSGGFYPLERCGRLFEGAGSDEALRRLWLDVARHVGHALLDDAAMLLITRRPEQPPGGEDRRGRLPPRPAAAAMGPGAS